MEFELFYMTWSTRNVTRYTCVIKGCDVIRIKSLLFLLPSLHLDGKTNDDVTGLFISNCEIPSSLHSSLPLAEIFPNLTALSICNNNLKIISVEDLKGFQHLNELYVSSNSIEHLPGDLFQHNPNLTHASFDDNKIKFIDPEIFDSLQNIERVDLRRNVNIDLLWNSMNGINLLKQQIYQNCIAPWYHARSKFSQGSSVDEDFDEENLVKILETQMNLEAYKAYEEELKKLEKMTI